MSETLARLCPSTQSYEMGRGGISELSDVEVAGLLAGLSRGPYLLARAMWVGDPSGIQEMQHLALVEAAHLFRPDQVLYPGFLRTLCAICLFQTIYPPACVECSGRRILYGAGGVVSDCEVCDGTGRGRTGGESVRALVDVEEGQWRRVARSYSDLEARIAGWQSTAKAHIDRKSKD